MEKVPVLTVDDLEDIMKPNPSNEGAKWNAPSHGDPTSAWLAMNGWVPSGLKQTPVKPVPKVTQKAARRGRR